MTDIDWWTDPDIAQVATAVGARYRGYVDAEDVKSVLLVWCLENPSTAGRAREGPAWFWRRRLWTVAERFARAEKAARDGYELDDEFFYTPGLVKEMLPDAFDNDSSPPQNGASEAKIKAGDGSRGFNWETAIADLQRALLLLPDKDYDLLRAIYGQEGGTLTAYCRVKNWNYLRGVRAERRAMRALIKHLGGGSPWLEDLNSPPPEEAQKRPPEGRRATNSPAAIHG